MKLGMKKRLSAVLVAGSLVLGGSFLAEPAAYAGGSGSAFAGPLYASASTKAWGGTQGRSYAKHGCKSAKSRWSSGRTNAWAACGVDLKSTARYRFR